MGSVRFERKLGGDRLRWWRGSDLWAKEALERGAGRCTFPTPRVIG
jgi:hypothetical protein